MTSVGLISIKPAYVAQIVGRTKTIELRRSSMGLSAGDVVLVYASAPEQALRLWFRIKAIESLPVEKMWARYHDDLGISRDEYLSYFEGARAAVGLHVGEIAPFAHPLPLDEIQRLVPGFVPPQALIWIRDTLGRYEEFLRRLPIALPVDALPQQTLPLQMEG